MSLWYNSFQWEKNLRYKLREDDYINTWCWLTPRELEEEFAGRSVMRRQISNYYNKYELPAPNEFRQKLIEEALNDCPKEISQKKRAAEIHEILDWKAEQAKQSLWNKIHSFESVWRDK